MLKWCIIIIIILATVTINFIFGENGLINRAEQARIEQEKATAREELTMLLGDAYMEKITNKENYDPNEYLDNYLKGKKPSIYLTETQIGIDGYVFGLDRSVPELGEYQGELTGPRIQAINVLEETTSSATIEVVTENAEGATYTYSYKINGTEEWIEVEIEDESSNTCTIEGLTQGEIYNIKVVVTTDTGTVEQEVNVYLGKIPEGTITFTPAEWVGDGTATTTINTTAEGFTLQYQVQSEDGTTTQWTGVENGGKIDGLEHGDTVYGRLFDGTNASKTDATTTVQDEVPPNAPLIITSGAVGNNGYYKSDATVTITGGNDGESGANKVRYVVTGAQTIAQTDTSDGTTSTNITISAEGESTITAYTLDKAGNVSTVATQTMNKDATAPSRASLTVGTVGETSIAVTANGADATSGIYSYEFQRSTTSATTGFTTVGGTQTSTATSYSYTYSNLTAETTYYLRVIVTDRAGNQTTSTAVTQKTNKKLASNVNELEEGDWVRYPAKTGRDIDCRVLYDSSSSYGVEIISAKSVENVELGNGTGSSQTNNTTYFNTAMNSYNNAIETLNDATAPYNNSTYSSRARCVGSDPSDPTSDSPGYFTSSFSYMASYNGQFKNQDTHSDTDFTQMETLGIENINKVYWLASRKVFEDWGSATFSVRFVDVRSQSRAYSLFYVSRDGSTTSHSDEAGLRPIFLLRSNIKVTGGTGEKGSPYTLGA